MKLLYLELRRLVGERLQARCTFCFKKEEAGRLIYSPKIISFQLDGNTVELKAAICLSCIELCRKIFQDDSPPDNDSPKIIPFRRSLER